MVLWSFVLKSPFGIVPGINSLVVNTVVLVAVSLLIPEKKELKEKREELRRLGSPEAEAERGVPGVAPVMAD
jgi:hypothetical protein